MPVPLPFHGARLWKKCIALLWLALAGASPAQSVFINELHYDNVGADAAEGVEIAGPAGTNLAAYQLVFYNGTNSPAAATAYSPATLSGIIPDQSNGKGVIWFAISGVQNGASDGVALYHTATSQLVQFLSYSGVITAADGVAAGATSTNLPVAESSSTPAGQSLQLQGSGSVYTNFTWHSPQAATAGQINTGQTFTAGPGLLMSLNINPSAVSENAGGNASTGTITLSPAPGSPVTVNLFNADPGEISIPASVIVTVSGTVNFAIAALTDGIADGDQAVIVTAADAASVYPSIQAGITIQDVDVPPPAQFTGVLRVAAFNVEFGVGSSGSAQFLAVKEVLKQLHPDVIAFEEVDAAGSFSDLKALLTQLGFQITRQYFATDGDAFAGQSYSPGDFGGDNQSVAIASRFPITQSVQINRGVAGRKEMARYPLFIAVDVPGVPAERDPAFVVVHLKANSSPPGQPDANEDQFRRALEAFRITQFLQQNGWDGATKNVFILGDFNEGNFSRPPLSFDTGPVIPGYSFPDGTSLPAGFQVGADLTGVNGITLTYNSASAVFPYTGMALANLASPTVKQADGVTQSSFNQGGTEQIDYIFASQPLVSNGRALEEIYNTRLELGFDGLAKLASLPTTNASYAASDHFAVFGDFALDATMPRLTLTAPPGLIDEAQTSSVTLTLDLSPAPVAPVSISFAGARPGRVAFPQPALTLGARQTSVNVPVTILHPPAIDPHRTVTIIASAPGWFPGMARLEIRNAESGGRWVVSQYQEPASGSAKKAVELLNRSGQMADLSATPLQVRVFNNGDVVGEMQATVEMGTVEAGQVLVIGDGATGEVLLTNGIIVPNGGFTPSQAGAPAAFFDSGGRLKFYRDSFDFNGDDALEILTSRFYREDVFGTIGMDPGVAWAGMGVSTQNQNLELRSHLATASQGFFDPSRRFSTAGSDDGLTGFGIAPALTDTYSLWAQSFALTGLNAALTSDPDGDGLVNLLEYVLTLSPVAANGIPWQAGAAAGPQATLTFRRRVAEPGLTYSVEKSSDLQAWTVAGVLIIDTQPQGDGTEIVTYSAAPSAGQNKVSLRLRVKRD